MKTLIQRSISGTIYVTLIIVSLLIHQVFFVSIFLLIGVLATLEFSVIKTHEHANKSILILPIVFVVSFVLSFVRAAGIISLEPMMLFVALVLLVLVYHVFNPENSSRSFLFHDALGLLYIILPLSLMPYMVFQKGDFSGFLVLSMFILIWINDIMAYVTGILLGRHKLYPRISPKKTWEGFIGGVIFSGLTGFFIYRYTGQGSLMVWLIYSILIAVFASVGDLFESMLKRQAGVKDSGKILPGHGGILDRIDSALFAIPVSYLFIDFFM